jgi:hypothetical protein
MFSFCTEVTFAEGVTQKYFGGERVYKDLDFSLFLSTFAA